MNARCTVVLAAFLSSLGSSVSSHDGRVGDFDGHADVGSPKLAGQAMYNAASQDYTVTAGGAGIGGSRDELHFVWKKMTGNFILQARVRFDGTGRDPRRTAGLIVRTTLDADAPYVGGVVRGDGSASLQFRRTKAGVTELRELPAKGSDVLQLERRGDTYIYSGARFGEPYASTELAGVAAGEDVFVGLALCSHDPDAIERAVFSDVRVIRPAREDFVPYREYIGSVLELLDVETGKRQVLHQSDEPFEAPNWTVDGTALIFNTSGRGEGRGRLFRFDLQTRQAALIDTSPNVRNNNDHVLSFDGTMLGISDGSEGPSAIYTVPADGGTPKRITPLTPSYLHGWSPDGKWLVYTGGRNKEFDIYKIPSDGSGPEVRLTSSPGLDDGPEYTPDGKYIYFNSVRSGTMQIWRMKPDGSDPEQVTNDGLNNWFPHISPDGKWIVFLSYPKEVEPSQHPYYKRVYLQLMPVTGGPSKVIAYVYGGQGTINVPSWSPDSRMVAFVSNTGKP